MNREKANPQSGKTFGSEYDARRAAKGAPKGGRRSGKGANGLEGEGEYEGHKDAGALDEEVVFADAALDGWVYADGVFYLL